jgi:methyltransferase (TIGR00027 family)
MLEARASITATIVARLRAAHQILDDDPKILVDPVAIGLVPASREDALRADAESLQTQYLRALRASIVMRSRYVEDVLQEITASGTRQYVNLGAGLDTFAYRQPSWAHALTLFEVDHPTTQQWKQARLHRLGIILPANLRWCPINFETTTLPDGLANAGFDFSASTCFSWLGVTQYLTDAAIDSTLRFVSSLPRGSSIVFTFILPESRLESEARTIRQMSATGASSYGEPFLTEFEPAILASRLRKTGFSNVIHFTTEAANRRYFSNRRDNLWAPGYAELMWATV